MSGGAWGYQSHKIEENAEVTRKLLLAVAQTEHIVDWAESGDTSIARAARDLYRLWVDTFNAVYGDR